jgi:hypothetical protein
VSEQESRQEFFLLRGQEAFQEIALPQGRASVASSACGFLPPQILGRA